MTKLLTSSQLQVAANDSSDCCLAVACPHQAARASQQSRLSFYSPFNLNDAVFRPPSRNVKMLKCRRFLWGGAKKSLPAAGASVALLRVNLQRLSDRLLMDID